MKFQRNYRITITPPDEDTITIEYPLTLEFDITRNSFADANTANFQIYNLGKSTRKKIFQDKFRADRVVFIDMEAGYGDELTLIFKGRVLQAYSRRDGVNVITEIQALDSDIGQSYTGETFEAGTTHKDAVKRIAADMPNHTVGEIGTLEGSFQNPVTIDGPSFYAISKITGGHCFVDLGKINILQDNEVINDAGVYKIDAESGLLSTPERRDAQLDVSMIFEPKIKVGQLVEIDSGIQSEFNGQYKVIGLNHSGTISGAVCGTLTTTLNIMIGAFAPNSAQVVSGVTSKQPFSGVKNSKVAPIDAKITSSARDVYNYITLNNAVPNKYCTKSIKWAQLIGNLSAQGTMPTLSVVANIEATAFQLQNFLDALYPGASVRVTSGWRSKSHNASIGGSSPTSDHIKGNAIDFSIPSVPMYYVGKTAAANWVGQTHYNGRHVHVGRTRNKGKTANDQ